MLAGEEFAELNDRAREKIGEAAAGMRAGRAVLHAGLVRLPRRLLAPLDLPGGGAVRFTEQQLTAIERRDSSILVSAGAGTGKTSVLVERFVRAVCEDGVDVASILAITFTEKAAAQLKQRVRARFVELNEIGHARESEAAWISTIHGFCARVLRTHALAAGIDPEFRVLDAVEAERLALDAFDGALAEFLERGESAERLRMIAAYNPRRLADMVRTAYDHLRSQGKEPALPVIDPPVPAGEREALAGRGRGRRSRSWAPPSRRRCSRRSTRWSAAPRCSTGWRRTPWPATPR